MTMTYREHNIFVEVTCYVRKQLEDDGSIGQAEEYLEDDFAKVWYVATDKDGFYLESASSLDEAKAFIDWTLDGQVGSKFKFEPVAV